jgi:hypothetical protein
LNELEISSIEISFTTSIRQGCVLTYTLIPVVLPFVIKVITLYVLDIKRDLNDFKQCRRKHIMNSLISQNDRLLFAYIAQISLNILLILYKMVH